MRECQRCKVELSSHGNSRFCNSCKQEGWGTSGAKPCKGCGKPCRGRNVTTMCRACALPPAPEKECETCSALFKAYRREQRYCSRECMPKTSRICAHCGGPRAKGRATCSDACATARMQSSAEAASHVGCRSETRRAKRKAERSRAYRRPDKAAVIERLTREQEGMCAVCDEAPTGTIRLVLDHDHATGEPRLMLCTRCNAAFGQMLESPERIKKLLAYAEVCQDSKCA